MSLGWDGRPLSSPSAAIGRVAVGEPEREVAGELKVDEGEKNLAHDVQLEGSQWGSYSVMCTVMSISTGQKWLTGFLFMQNASCTAVNSVSFTGGRSYRCCPVYSADCIAQHTLTAERSQFSKQRGKNTIKITVLIKFLSSRPACGFM